MHLWRVSDNDTKDGVVHQVAPGFGHGLLAPLVAHAFQRLNISAAVWEHAYQWFPIHTAPTVFTFEEAHGMDRERVRYNGQQLGHVLREGRMVLGQHAGFCDLFVPVVTASKVVAILVTGPFARSRPTGDEVRERWRWLTGRAADLADPGFASYLSLVLSLLVLDEDKVATFERLLACLTALMAGDGDAGATANEAEALGAALAECRFPERMWDAARQIVDDRYGQGWHGAATRKQRSQLRLSRVGDGVLVALAVDRAAGTDPVDLAIRCEGLQRACCELARRWGDTVAGQVGDRGVLFVASTKGSLATRQRRLRDVADKAAVFAARRFGLTLYAGASVSVEGAPLSHCYQAALGAAECAAVRSTPFVHAGPAPGPTPPLRELRQALGPAMRERPDQLEMRFDRYMETVAASCANQLDLMRLHLEMGFEEVSKGLAGSGVLDAKSRAALAEALDRAAREAGTAADLFGAYRRAVGDIRAAFEAPVASRRDQSLRRALEYIGQRYAEPLLVEQVARVAGFAPDHFSRLFKRREGVTFEQYLRALRVEQSKKLLADTELPVVRVSELSGFHSPQYFSRTFHRAMGVTPLAYRRRPRPATGRGAGRG